MLIGVCCKLQFKEWFDEAVRQDLPEPNAMTLATANQDGRP
jgi:pyridoxine/pyridoxamine 5'-phosphate oxidase